MLLDLSARWSCVSYHHNGKGSDELIVEIRKSPSWWGRVWRKEDDVVHKVVFVGSGYDWHRPPHYEQVADDRVRARLFDLWVEASRDYRSRRWSTMWGK